MKFREICAVLVGILCALCGYTFEFTTVGKDLGSFRALFAHSPGWFVPELRCLEEPHRAAHTFSPICGREQEFCSVGLDGCFHGGQFRVGTLT
jgi:hypothetical protein